MESFWYVLMCFGFGAGYFAKVSGQFAAISAELVEGRRVKHELPARTTNKSLTRNRRQRTPPEIGRPDAD